MSQFYKYLQLKSSTDSKVQRMVLHFVNELNVTILQIHEVEKFQKFFLSMPRLSVRGLLSCHKCCTHSQHSLPAQGASQAAHSQQAQAVFVSQVLNNSRPYLQSEAFSEMGSFICSIFGQKVAKRTILGISLWRSSLVSSLKWKNSTKKHQLV